LRLEAGEYSNKQESTNILALKRSSDRNEVCLGLKENEANEQHKSIIEALKMDAPEWTFERLILWQGGVEQ